MNEMISGASAADKYAYIAAEVASIAQSAALAVENPTLVAVSKTYDADTIRPVLQAGCRVFGENRVQEAAGKWPQLREEFPDLELHLIGPLQSNKTAQAVALFDMIETVDREKIAKALAIEMEKQDRKLPVLVQVNTGLEEQKAGIAPKEVPNFVQNCIDLYQLDVRGLMCIPPFDENPGPHFVLLSQLADQLDLPIRSMGMSGDYPTAIEFGATHVRVGSAIFGARTTA